MRSLKSLTGLPGVMKFRTCRYSKGKISLLYIEIKHIDVTARYIGFGILNVAQRKNKEKKAINDVHVTGLLGTPSVNFQFFDCHSIFSAFRPRMGCGYECFRHGFAIYLPRYLFRQRVWNDFADRLLCGSWVVQSPLARQSPSSRRTVFPPASCLKS